MNYAKETLDIAMGQFVLWAGFALADFRRGKYSAARRNFMFALSWFWFAWCDGEVWDWRDEVKP